MKRVRRVPKLPDREAAAHKGDFGTVCVLAGSERMLGAAILCARAALRGGAGLVRVGLPRALVTQLPLAVPEAMTFPRTGRALDDALAAADAIVVGPGLSAAAATRQLVRTVLAKATVPLVLDADALNVLAPLRRRVPARAPFVLTPHPGEAARLLGVDTQQVQADRERHVAELAARSGGVAVLKGAGTLVADETRRFANDTGNPGMATGGSGDVLAGLLGALLARGMHAFDAACLAVHAHGRAGDVAAARLGETAMLPSDLIDDLAAVLR